MAASELIEIPCPLQLQHNPTAQLNKVSAAFFWPRFHPIWFGTGRKRTHLLLVDMISRLIRKPKMEGTVCVGISEGRNRRDYQREARDHRGGKTLHFRRIRIAEF